ncbi:MAG: hotdog domain-containing protein [Planctomycetales bacterium]
MADQTSERYLALKHVMMPRDTNPQGTIFGGVLLSYIDLAGSVGAIYEVRKAGWPEQSIVTVAMNSVEFHQPCYVGDLVSFWTELVKVGQTSITMHVTVEADQQGANVKLTEADVTYVSVRTEEGQRMPVPIRGGEPSPEDGNPVPHRKPLPPQSTFSPLW